jgi:hypothetical protein
MRKLTLNLDQLAVDSFDTAAATEKKGTVFGEQCTCQTQCSCPGCPTCDYTCDDVTCAASCGSCEPTCDASCWYGQCPSNPTCNPSNDPNWVCCPY